MERFYSHDHLNDEYTNILARKLIGDGVIFPHETFEGDFPTLCVHIMGGDIIPVSIVIWGVVISCWT